MIKSQLIGESTMKGYSVTVATCLTSIFIDDLAFEWAKLNQYDEKCLIAALARKFHGPSYDKKNIYIKKIFKLREFEDYLEKVSNNHQQDNQTIAAIKNVINEEKRQSSFATGQYRLYFAKGNRNGKITHPNENQSQFFAIGESFTEEISISYLPLQQDIKIEPIEHIDANAYSEIFSTKFSMEQIQKDYEQVKQEDQKKIEIFNQKVLTGMFALAKENSNTNSLHTEMQVSISFPDFIIINENNYQANIPLIEKRLGLDVGKLEEITRKALVIKAKIETGINNARQNYTKQIEANIFSLENKLEGFSTHNLSEENNSKLTSYITSQIKHLKSLYGKTKAKLLLPSDSHAAAISYIDNIPNKVREQLRLLGYGNCVDIIPQFKECLMIALYNAALEYRTNILKNLTEKDILTKPQSKIEDFNKKFSGVADLNDLLQISSIEQSRTNFGRLSKLSMLETFIYDLLQVSDDRQIYNAQATQTLLDQLEKAKIHLQKSLGFTPFEVQQKTIRKWSRAYFKFSTNTIECENLAEEAKMVFSNEMIESYNGFLDGIGNKSAETFIAEEIKAELVKINDISFQIILNVNAFQRLISHGHAFEQLIESIKKHRTSSDMMFNFIDKKQKDIYSYLPRSNINNFEEQAKLFFMEKLNSFKENAEVLLLDLDRNTTESIKTERNFRSAFIPLLESLSQEQLAEQNSTDEIIEMIKYLEVICNRMSEIKIQFEKLKKEVEYADQLINISIQSKQFIVEANKIVLIAYQDNTKQTIGELQVDALEFYSNKMAELKKLKQQTENLANLFNQSLPAVEQSISDDIDREIQGYPQFKNLLKQKQKTFSIKLVCHLMVNALLSCYQTEDVVSTKHSFILDRQVLRRLLTNNKVQQHAPENHSFLDVVLDEAYQGWCENEEKASNLLLALQRHCQQPAYESKGVSKAMLKFQSILRELSLETISDDSICNLSTQLVSFNCLPSPRVSLFSQKALVDQIKSIVANEKIPNLESNHPSYPKTSSVVNHNRTILEFPDQQPLKDSLLFINNPRVRTIKLVNLEQQAKRPGFFKRHWGKCLFGLIFAVLVVGGIFTAGLVPAIAAGILSLAGSTIIVGPILAAGLGVTGIAMASMVIGMGMAALSKTLIVSKEDGALGFFKRHWGKLGLACALTSIGAASLFILGGSVLISALAIGVITSSAALGLTMTATIAGVIGAGVVAAGLGMLSVIAGVTTGILADGCCGRSKKVSPHCIQLEENNKENPDRHSEEDEELALPTVLNQQRPVSMWQGTDCFLKQHFQDIPLLSLPQKNVELDQSVNSPTGKNRVKNKNKAKTKIAFIEDPNTAKSNNSAFRRV